MDKVISFLKRHWTWISGFLGAIFMYASPGLQHAITNYVSSHPEYSDIATTALLLLAHLSPSPLQSGGSNASSK